MLISRYYTFTDWPALPALPSEVEEEDLFDSESEGGGGPGSESKACWVRLNSIDCVCVFENFVHMF